MSVAIETQPLMKSETEREPVSVVLPSNVRLEVSSDDFWTLCAFNRDLRLERGADGELIAMSPAGSSSGARNFQLNMQLGIWADRDQTGIGFDSSAGFTFPDGAVRGPDASWIRLERWNALADADKDQFAPIVPDFVVELLSRTDSLAETRAKMIQYIEQGVRLGWLIDPKKQTVEIYRTGRAVVTLIRPNTLSGEDVLPGFILELNKILTTI